jgi:hypothetical protein
MYIPLRRFSSIEELAPVFEHGGQVVFMEIIRPCMIVKGESHPWKIVMITWKGLNILKEDLLHEFIHLFHRSLGGYTADPNETKIFHETETERQTKRLMKRNPGIVDEITRELILHPNCSVIFPPDGPRNPFKKYYRDLVAELAMQARNGSITDQAQRIKVLQIAETLGV